MTPPGTDPLRDALSAALAAGDLALSDDDLVLAGEALHLDPQDLTADDLTLDTLIDTRIHAPARTKLLHPRLVVYEHAQAIAEALGPLPTPGDRVHAIVSGNFIFGDLIEAWIMRHNWEVPDLWVTTLGMSANNVDSLANLLHGDYVTRLHLAVSDYFYFHERGPGGLVGYLYDELDAWGGDRFQLFVIGSHTKIALIATADGARYVIYGSANLRSAGQIEQITIEHDPDLYAFHLAWLQALEAQYSTIDHTQPRRMAPKRQQWQAVTSTAAPTTNGNAPPTRPAPKPPTRASGARTKPGERRGKVDG